MSEEFKNICLKIILGIIFCLLLIGGWIGMFYWTSSK